MRKLLGISLALLLLLLSGCGAANKKEETNKMYRILFIGNSYTFYNDMPTQFFQKIAERAGYQVQVSSITKGAHTLEKFADPDDSFGVLVAEELNEQYAGQYDYVVLQEQSFRPVGEEAPLFYDAVRNLTERIRAVDAEPVLYATWGYKEGHATLAAEALTREDMTWKLAAAYSSIGETLDVPVAHVGLAFRSASSSDGQIELHTADCSHPTEIGSCLAGLTLFCRIFQQQPTAELLEGLVAEEHAELLCQAAKAAVFDTPQIPDEYRVTSEGVTNAG